MWYWTNSFYEKQNEYFRKNHTIVRRIKRSFMPNFKLIPQLLRQLECEQECLVINRKIGITLISSKGCTTFFIGFSSAIVSNILKKKYKTRYLKKLFPNNLLYLKNYRIIRVESELKIYSYIVPNIWQNVRFLGKVYVF